MDNAPALVEELDELELLRLELEELALELEALDTLLIELDDDDRDTTEELLALDCEELDTGLDEVELDDTCPGELETLELLELESLCPPEQAASTAVIVSADIVFSWIFMT